MVLRPSLRRLLMPIVRLVHTPALDKESSCGHYCTFGIVILQPSLRSFLMPIVHLVHTSAPDKETGRGGNGLLLFLMMFLYISMVRSSYIIIVSGMGDDVPILDAVVVLFEAMVSAYHLTNQKSEIDHN